MSQLYYKFRELRTNHSTLRKPRTRKEFSRMPQFLNFVHNAAFTYDLKKEDLSAIPTRLPSLKIFFAKEKNF
ncbi:hypothetical protein BpHYR1_035406 [Brachionus plicatilis]|uniref:Uncharacterized protein n=1 Tax=Brachionus plicatilis TaxID=10195 RepID=A0A3M7QHH8_BRAPC|nr:hypothetical protein BpHYR1_035406 [Brachionus plicatilis]